MRFDNEIHFKDRLQAGEMLAKPLAQFAGRQDAVVLALPRGGVPVGHAVAEALHIPLDVLIVRKLGMPGQEEYAIGAVAGDRKYFLQPDAIDAFGIAPEIVEEIVEEIVKRELREIARREQRYRAGRPKPQLRGRTVILVDDGIATGSTMQIAAQVVRQELPAQLIVAIPVAAPDACEKLAAQVDRVICLSMPAHFRAVGQYFDDFRQTTDDEVIQLLAQARRRMEHAGSILR